VPATSLLTLLDDIATLLDNVAGMTKIAARKTAGVVGDDLALNAEQVTGVHPDRELPVVWAVAKGSMINKVILVPAALAISAIAPWAITPLLMLGGAFLCYEGFEKLVHKLTKHPGDEAHEQEVARALVDPTVDVVALEKDKIKGAIRTDFILSAEIIVISLGAIATAPFGTRVAALCAIAALMTVGVYALVAGIVKLDDAGVALSARESPGARRLGAAILWTAPYLMKGLSVAGTVAMFLVGGGILAHGIPGLEQRIEALGSVVATLAPGAIGVAAGAILVGIVLSVKKLRRAAIVAE
jgi:predicted DNA repair protein MutK